MKECYTREQIETAVKEKGYKWFEDNNNKNQGVNKDSKNKRAFTSTHYLFNNPPIKYKIIMFLLKNLCNHLLN